MAQFWLAPPAIVNIASNLKRTQYARNVIASEPRQSRDGNGVSSGNQIATSLRSSR